MDKEKKNESWCTVLATSYKQVRYEGDRQRNTVNCQPTYAAGKDNGFHPLKGDMAVTSAMTPADDVTADDVR